MSISLDLIDSGTVGLVSASGARWKRALNLVVHAGVQDTCNSGRLAVLKRYRTLIRFESTHHG